jgi:hypothetical protein
MGIWQFVLTETPDGQHDHGHNHDRRKIAWRRAEIAGISKVSDHDRNGDVCEREYPPGVFNYTWMVNDPNDPPHVFALVAVFEAQVPQSVYCSSGPTRVVTPAERATLHDLFVKLRDFDDSGIK